MKHKLCVVWNISQNGCVMIQRFRKSNIVGFDYNLILNLFYTGSRTQNTLRIPVQPVQLISL